MYFGGLSDLERGAGYWKMIQASQSPETVAEVHELVAGDC
jgi:hypothetical protein